MPRPCSVCVHPKHWEIDQLLVTNELSNRAVARKYKFSASSVDRHKNDHMPQQLGVLARRIDALAGEEVLGQLGELYLKAMEIFAELEVDSANKKMTVTQRLRALKEARQIMDGMAKVSFQMQGSPSRSETKRIDIDSVIERELNERRVEIDAEAEEVEVKAETANTQPKVDPTQWRQELAALPSATRGDASQDIIDAYIHEAELVSDE